MYCSNCAKMIPKDKVYKRTTEIGIELLLCNWCAEKYDKTGLDPNGQDIPAETESGSGS
jgi:hypothetical protein